MSLKTKNSLTPVCQNHSHSFPFPISEKRSELLTRSLSGYFDELTHKFFFSNCHSSATVASYCRMIEFKDDVLEDHMGRKPKAAVSSNESLDPAPLSEEKPGVNLVTP